MCPCLAEDGRNMDKYDDKLNIKMQFTICLEISVSNGIRIVKILFSIVYASAFLIKYSTVCKMHRSKTGAVSFIDST